MCAGKSAQKSLSLIDLRSARGDSFHLVHAILILIGRKIVRKIKRNVKGIRKKEESKRKTEMILNCARELEKLKNRLGKELLLIAKPEDLTQLW